jgi:hypothetical protein
VHVHHRVPPAANGVTGRSWRFRAERG